MKKYFLTISILLLTFTGTAFATTSNIPYYSNGQYRVQDAVPTIASTSGEYFLSCNATTTFDGINDGGATWYEGKTDDWFNGHPTRGIYPNYVFTFRPTGQSFATYDTCSGSINVLYGGATPSPTPTPTASPTPTPTISITTPTGTVDNFGVWAGSCYAYGTDYGQIAIMYGDNDPATSTASAWDYTEYSSTKGNCADINSENRYWNLSRTHELDLATTTTWYARAIYYNPVCTGTFPNQICTNNVYAYGTTTFSFLENASTSFVYADPIIDPIPWTGIERSKIEIYTDIENKFPFAYFYDLRNIYFTARSFSEDQFPSYTINMASSSIPITANIFSSSTLTQFMGNTTFNILKSLLSAVLWLGLGWYVYQRIKNLQL